MRPPLPLAPRARLSDNLAHSVAVPAHLLHHEGPLLHGLETLATTATASRGRGAWFRFSPFAGDANFSAAK